MLQALSTVIHRWWLTLPVVVGLGTLTAASMTLPGGGLAVALCSPIAVAILLRLGASAAMTPARRNLWAELAQLVPRWSDFRAVTLPGESRAPLDAVVPSAVLWWLSCAVMALVLPPTAGLLAAGLPLLLNIYRGSTVSFPIHFGAVLRGASTRDALTAAGAAAAVNHEHRHDNTWMYGGLTLAQLALYSDVLFRYSWSPAAIAGASALLAIVAGAYCQHAWDEVMGPDAEQKTLRSARLVSG